MRIGREEVRVGKTQWWQNTLKNSVKKILLNFLYIPIEFDLFSNYHSVLSLPDKK